MTEQALSEAADGTPAPEADAADAEQDVTLDEGGDAGGSSEQDEDSALEAEAREMGWVPESEWKGEKKPRKFYSAKEFVERGETILPIALKRAREAEAKLADVEKKWEERFSRMEKMSAKALERQKEKLVADFEARKREAVKLGDEEGYDAAEKAKERALKELDEQSSEPEPEKTQDGALKPADLAALTEWKGENAWFQKDKKLTILMDAEFAEVSDEMPGATFAQKLAEARNRVAAVYPEKFGEKAPSKRAGAVESGSRMAGGGGGGRQSDRLPAEAKSAFKTLVNSGVYEANEIEDYAKEYFKEEPQ